MKKRTKEKIRGSVTVLLVIILLPMLAFSSVIVDISRVNLAKAQIASAGALALNSTLANYDTVLKDVYGIFANSQEKSYTELSKDIEDYFKRTILSYGVVSEDELDDYVGGLMSSVTGLVMGTTDASSATDFLEYSDVSLTVSGVDGSQLSNPDVLRNQILEYMKYRAPINFGMSFFDTLASFQAVSDQNAVVDEQVKAQQSTQKVTSACSKLIALIREYDVLVEELNKSVTGKDSPDDGVEIQLKDYPSQIVKYGDNWANHNYKHINDITVVFLANSPDVKSVYLSGLDYSGGVYFIKSDNSGLVYENSGINVTLSLAGDTASAKTQIEDQLTFLTDTHKTVAESYVTNDFINAQYLVEDRNSFTDENAAISSFANYKKFLNNELESVKYSQVADALEDIYIAGKYYDNYIAKIDADIQAEQNKINSASNAMTTAQTNMNNAKTGMSDVITNINNKLSELEDDAFRQKNFDIDIYISNHGCENELPALGDDYQEYYDNYLKGKYHVCVDALVEYYKDSDLSDVANKIDEFLNDKATWEQVEYTAGKYKKYNGPEYAELMEKLIYFKNQEANFATYIQNYSKASATYNEQAGIKSAAEAQKELLEGEKAQVKSAFETCMGAFNSFSKTYQSNAYYYGEYKKTAKNIVNRETGAIDTQFSLIKDNIDKLVKKLDAISKQAEAAKKEVEAYQKYVNNWETANNKYIEKNGSDSFSDGVEADIETAHNEYNLDSFGDLKEFVDNLYAEFNNFYTHITAVGSYSYGSKKIYDIANSVDAVAALETAKAGFPVTTDLSFAQTQFSSLFANGTVFSYVPFTLYYEYGDADGSEDVAQLRFLGPTIIQIQALKYLNSAYPEAAESEGSSSEEEDKDAEDIYNDFEKDSITEEGSDSSVEDIKGVADNSSSTGNSGNSGESDKDKDKDALKKDEFGYTYKNKGNSNVSDEKTLPSAVAKTESSSVKDDQMEFSKDEDGDIDASAGKSSQSGVMSKLLGDLGSAIETGLENAYIMSYLFDNFSYNTLIQDAIIEKAEEKGENITSFLQFNSFKAKDEYNTYLEECKDKLVTLSQYHFKGENNYLYGAELEYILYGNDDIKKNVTYMKASIYAIRFAFDCIFAFTDSEIRSTTMAIGLSVQAASLGIVPYQLVQIVLQLALAAAEAGLDLQAICNGVDVVVVKTKDTWQCSLSSVSKELVNEVANTATSFLTSTAEKVISDLAGGLQGIVDAGAEELTGAVDDLKDSLLAASNATVENIVTQAFDVVMSKVENSLNEFQNTEWGEILYNIPTKEDVKTRIYGLLDGVEEQVITELKTTFAGNDLAMKVVGYLETNGVIGAVVSDLKVSIDKKLQECPEGVDPSSHIMSQLTLIKLDIIKGISYKTNAVLNGCADYGKDAVKEAQNKINEAIGKYGDQITEQVTETIKTEISGIANDYIGKYVDVGNNNVIGGGSSSSSVAAAFTFGYKEYLMLFMFVGLCSNGDAILTRTADVIQLNLMYANDSSEFKHNQGKNFQMNNAYTYVMVDASAKLEMFFVESDLFADILYGDDTSPTGATGSTGDTGSTGEAGDSGDASSDPSAATPAKDNSIADIIYKGVLGY